MSKKVTKVDEVEGLYYVEDIIKDPERFVEKLDKKEWVPITNSKNSRVVQHYGYKYNYTSRSIRDPAEPFPPFIRKFQKKLTKICRELDIIKDDYEFDQCIVNNYNCGQGISKHIDVVAYGDVIGCFTLGSGATMKFTRGEESFSIYVKPNSLYIMSGDARYKWKHEMQSKQSDNGIKRGRRISVTFRNVPKK